MKKSKNVNIIKSITSGFKLPKHLFKFKIPKQLSGFKLPKQYQIKNWNLKVRIMVGISGIILLLIVILSLSSGEQRKDLPYYTVKSAPFKEFLSLNGVLEAERSVSISAPQVRRYSFKLIDLIPEGTIVKKGDLIAEFDIADIKEKIESHETQLEDLSYELEDLEQSHTIRMYSLEDRLKSTEDNLRLSKLTVKAMEYSSELNKRKAEINIEKAKTAIEEAKRDIKSQKLKNQIELRKKKQKISYYEKRVEDYKKQMRKFKVFAPEKGIVIYPYIGRGNSKKKIQVGDSLWYGQTFAILPDLTRILVHLQINEIEIYRIRLGLKTEIVLDSYKDKKYTGFISDISRIATEDDKNELIKNFDCYIKINEVDIDHLKPGISAVCDITISTMEAALAVPIETVFRDEKDRAICLVLNSRKVNPREVKLGPRNENYIVIKEGLKPGDKVSLVNLFEEGNAYKDYKIDEYKRIGEREGPAVIESGPKGPGDMEDDGKDDARKKMGKGGSKSGGGSRGGSKRDRGRSH